MKIALTCDYLLGGGHYEESLSFLLEIFPKAPIYTLAYCPQNLSPAFRSRTIHSSYLAHGISSPSQLLSKAWAIPSAAKRLKIPCDTNLVLSFSRGLGHGIDKCPQTQQITYLYDTYSPKGGFFSAYLKSWSKRKLLASNEIWAASPSLLAFCQKLSSPSQLLLPGFKVQDFPLFSDEQRKHFPQNFYAIVEESPSLKEFLEEHKFPYKFVTNCPGQAAPLLAGSSALIDLRAAPFPRSALAALATGTSVVVCDTKNNRDFLGKLEGRGVAFIRGLDQLPNALKELKRDLNPRSLRALAMKHSEIAFKAALRRKLSQSQQIKSSDKNSKLKVHRSLPERSQIY